MSQFNSLSDYLPLLKRQIAAQELLSEYLYKTFDLALTDNFLYYKICEDAGIAILFGGYYV